MTSRTLTVIVAILACLVGVAPVALSLHYVFHVGWAKTLLLFIVTLLVGFIPILGGYFHGFKPWRRSQSQKVAFVSAPVGVGISYVIGSLLGYPRLGGAIGFAGVLGAIAYYFLGRGAGDGSSSEEGLSE